MPIDTSVRARTAATMPACRAVVAVRLHAPESERAFLRAVRVLHFSGELLDDPQTLDRAARDAGLDPADLELLVGRARHRRGARRGPAARP